MDNILQKIRKDGISCLDSEENKKAFYNVNSYRLVLEAIKKDKSILKYANPKVQIDIINNSNSDDKIKENYENASDDVKKDEKILKLVYKKNIVKYRDLSENMKRNMEIIKQAISKREYVIDDINKNNINEEDKIKIYKLLYEYKNVSYNQLPNELKNNKEIIKKAFFRDEIEFDKIPNEIKDEIDFLSECVNKEKISINLLSQETKNNVLKYQFLINKLQYDNLPKELKKDKDIIEKIYHDNLEIIKQRIGDKLRNRECYEEAKYVLSKVDNNLLHDVEFVKRLLNYNVDLIDILKDGEIEKNEDIINLVIEKKDRDKLEEEFINTKNYVEKYIGDKILTKNLTIKEIRDNEELVKLALENGASLNFASSRLKTNKDFLIDNYLSKVYRNYNLIPHELYKDKDIMNIIYYDKAVEINSEDPPVNIEFNKFESLNNYRNSFFIVNDDELKNNKEQAIEVLKTYMLSRDYKHFDFDKWIPQKYIYADEIFSDEEFIKKALEVNPNIIRDIPTEYFKEDYIELGCKGNRNLDVLPKNYFLSKENAIKLTQKIGWCLESFPKEFREDKELVRKLNDIENSRDNTMEFTTVISDKSKINDIDLYEDRKIEGDEFETNNLRNAGIGGIWGAKKDDIYGSEWIKYVFKNSAPGYDQKYDDVNKVDYVTKDTTRVISFDQFKDTIYEVYTHCENSNMSSKEKRETMLNNIKKRIGNDKIEDLILFYSEKSAKDKAIDDIIAVENNQRLLKNIEDINEKEEELKKAKSNVLRIYFAGTYADTRTEGFNCPTLMLNKTSAVNIQSQEIIYDLHKKIESKFKERTQDFYDKYIKKCDYEERINKYSINDLIKEKSELEIKLEKSEKLKVETEQYYNRKKIQKDGVDYIGK